MLENDEFGEDLKKEISFEEGYILGMTISGIELYKIGRREIKRAYRSDDLFSDETKKTLRNVRKLLLNEPYSADLEIYLHKYPRLDNKGLNIDIALSQTYGVTCLNILSH